MCALLLAFSSWMGEDSSLLRSRLTDDMSGSVAVESVSVVRCHFCDAFSKISTCATLEAAFDWASSQPAVV